MLARLVGNIDVGNGRRDSWARCNAVRRESRFAGPGNRVTENVELFPVGRGPWRPVSGGVGPEPVGLR